MRIVVNDIAASEGGALSVLQDFYEYVSNRSGGHEWIFLVGEDGLIQERAHIKVIVRKGIKRSWLRRLWFELAGGRGLVNGLCPAAFFSLQNILTWGVKARGVVYVHQAICYQDRKRFSFFKRQERIYAVYQHILSCLVRSSTRRSDAVIVQTEWAREALARKDGISKDKILCVRPRVWAERLPERNFDPGYFFYPAADIPYKNHDCIVRACECLEHAGITDYRVEFTLADENGTAAHSARRRGARYRGTRQDRTWYDPAGRIRLIGRIPREEVFEKYASGTLLFPSYIESFGYPLAEARMVGTLILAADCTYAHELLDDYENAYFFDPFDPRALAELMGKVARGEVACREVPQLREYGKNGWAKVAEVIEGGGGVS
ncbi:MAG: glycosyltransferase [Clostridium sp.]|jgi:glycosyltransferase involved in cell wall biosynthesis|nr:glycosyltransferase [Clostridium sp.]